MVSVPPLQGVRVQSLVKELRSHMPCGAGRKTKPQTKHKSSAILYQFPILEYLCVSNSPMLNTMVKGTS